jgi:hypothetical protein
MDKKGLSVIIGYLLLISFAIILSAMIYAWLKTYVPKDTPECPDGVSIYIDEVNCTYNGTDYLMDLVLENNGRFKFAGYYIHATNDPSQETATLNLYNSLDEGGVKFGNTVLFASGNSNTIEINGKRTSSFLLNETIYSLSIIPTRFETIDGKTKYIGCSKGRAEENVECS